VADILLLPRFFEQIRLHLVSCYEEIPQWPVILGIFGRSGDGKSAQLTAALEQCEVEIARVNAADLESGVAGEPGKHLARTYGVASMAIDKGIPTALVVDDIDTTVGEWEMNTGTVNHQQVLAELMHIADRPVNPGRNQPRCVPIFVTGNNLTRLYAPLRRPGRMRSMTWRPNERELLAVVERLFSDIADYDAMRVLAHDFHDETLAFFAQLRQAMREVELRQSLRDKPRDMRALLKLRRSGEISERPPLRVPSEQVLALAHHVRAARDEALEDFLRESDQR
jgi:hypothetical protein